MNPEPIVPTMGRRSASPVPGWVTVLFIAVVGLALVKWVPYYHKGLFAAANHSIGSSILMGNADRPPAPSARAAIDYAVAYGNAIWRAMVLGLLLGSAIQVLLPRYWIASSLGGSGLRSVILGGVLSLPGMMCTCCAAPIVAGLRECRAAPGSAVAFWLGNTVLNPATLIFTGFVLGWRWSALRLVAGLFMVFGLGWLVNRLAGPAESIRVDPVSAARVAEEDRKVSLARWLIALGRMFGRLVPEFVVLVLVLGATRAWLFPHVGHDVDNSPLWILAFAIAGAIFVIPTAGEVPIVQAMLALGVGVGPAAALLMTLAPISVPSVAMLWGSFGPRTLRVVLIGVIVLGWAVGITATWLFA
jgi:uncharacterized membrane protein YraQ (UPF0718 family)